MVVHTDESRQPQSFNLLIQKSDDIVIVGQPSWWTTRHTLQVVGVLGGLIVATMGWVTLLRGASRSRPSRSASNSGAKPPWRSAFTNWWRRPMMQSSQRTPTAA